MKSLRHQKQEGFTLPEMLVTVGIVGLLAAVSIPSYQKYTARARQAEAKASLSSIFTAERNYSVDSRTYTNCLTRIGVNSPGAHYYGCGFAPYNPSVAACGPGGTTACNTYLYDEGAPVAACVAADNIPISATSVAGSMALVTSGSNYGTLNANLPGGGYSTITGVTNAAFVAACAGNVGSSGYDNWVIDNNQNLGNVRAGI